ncbi:MAG: peptidoglycan editing factor PgeF [Robiginitomaculum sp.]|nr:peptidoglycan editing factor PgeF [Robiginitomaculum sp.]
MFKSLTQINSRQLAGDDGLSHGFYGMPETTAEFDVQDPALFKAQTSYIAEKMQIPTNRMIEVEQIHSAKVRPVAAPWAVEKPQADAMVTNAKGLALVIKTADCAPVLLADTQTGVIGAAHAGWRGALAGVLEQTVLHMTFLGAQRKQIIASIGPCIAQESYEVGEEFADEFLENSAFNGQFFLQPSPPKLQFDLAEFCAHQLKQSGISSCDIIGTDTFLQQNSFFSYRRSLRNNESGYGRNLSVICLPKQ